MNLADAAEAYLASLRPQAIDVDLTRKAYGSLEHYLYSEGEHYDDDHPWLRYIEVSQWDHVDGHAQIIEWEDGVEILLPMNLPEAEDYLNRYGRPYPRSGRNLTEDQAAEWRKEFHDRVTEEILETCEHAEITIAPPGKQGLIRIHDGGRRWDVSYEANLFLEGVIERTLEEMSK